MLSRMVLQALGMCAIPIALLFSSQSVRAQAPCAQGNCYAQECFTCQHTHCPPALKHCMEGPPHICFKCGCPRPICNPCMNPNWGYFETCWNPWPWPPDFSHCRAVPPAATITLNPGLPAGIGAPSGSSVTPDNILPAPRTLRPGL